MSSKLQKKSLFEKLQEEQEKLNDNLDEENLDVEEDYLEEDKPLPNQNFVCLSFASPEKVLKTKEDYYFYYYTLEMMSNIREYIKKETDKILEKALTGTIDSSELVEYRKAISSQLSEEIEFPSFKEKLDNFKYKNEEEIEKLYHEENNFQTSIRGVKVRGVFATYKQAQVRAKVLQKIDKNFHVYVGQVGYWLPWDPNPDNVEDQEYMNDKLNKIVGAYKENQEKKNAFFEEEMEKQQAELAQRRREAREKKKQEAKLKEQEEQQEQELSEEEKQKQEEERQKQEEQLKKQKEEDERFEAVMEEMNTDSHSTQDSSLAEERAKIEDIDPWMQRKMREEAGLGDSL